MATLSADKSRKFHVTDDDRYGRAPIIATDIVYQGAAVGESSSTGTGRPLVGGDNFMGFANAKADNASGAASAIDIDLRVTGEVELPITGVASEADFGSTVYASDDDTFTLTSSGNSAIGKLVRWITSTTALVRFEGVQHRSI